MTYKTGTSLAFHLALALVLVASLIVWGIYGNPIPFALAYPALWMALLGHSKVISRARRIRTRRY